MLTLKIFKWFVNHFNWQSTFESLNVESAFNMIFNALYQSILHYMQLRGYNHYHFPPWFTKELKEMLFLKKEKHMRHSNLLIFNIINISNYHTFSLLWTRF